MRMNSQVVSFPSGTGSKLFALKRAKFLNRILQPNLKSTPIQRTCISAPLFIGSIMLTVLASSIDLAGQPVQAPSATNAMSLRQVVEQVLVRNESIQIRQIEAEVSRKGEDAEHAVFEPRIVTSVDHLDSRRQNNVQQQSSLLSIPNFSERNSSYNTGIEFLLPTGAKLNTGATLRDLRNNVQSLRVLGREYEAFVGASISQPLLKNFGPVATGSRIRLAALISDIAFQEYRRQLMMVVGRTESAYWDLYLTQEQERITAESIAVASTILEDNKNRAQLGQSSEIEVLRAQAGVHLREARHKDARLRRVQAAGQLAVLISDANLETNVLVLASDHPEIYREPLTYYNSYQQAFDLNPDYITRRKQAQQEKVRLAYAKNQRLPQLDLKASYGLNGLDSTPSGAWDTVTERGYPAWSVGMEMRIPLLGGLREKSEVDAAKLNQKKALLAIREIETQIGSALETALLRVRLQAENVTNYTAAVDFHERLLKDQRERLALGRVDTRSVLEVEEKLFEAKLAVLDNLIQHRKGLIDLELVSGSILQTRSLDLTKAELSQRTKKAMNGEAWSSGTLERYARTVERGDQRGDLSPAALQQRLWIEQLRRESGR